MDPAGAEPERPPPPDPTEPETAAEPGEAPARPAGPALLPAHRIALRAGVGALIGAAAGTTWAMGALLLLERGFRVAEVPLVALLTTVGGGAILAFLLVSEQLALRLRPALRPPLLLLAGAGGGLLVAAAVVWVQALVDGRGTSGAWEALADIWGWAKRNPSRSLVISVDPLLAFLTLGTLRTLSRAVHPLLQALAGALAGLLALALHSLLWRAPGWNEVAVVATVFAGFPAACALGLWGGERLERRIVDALERWRPE